MRLALLAATSFVLAVVDPRPAAHEPTVAGVRVSYGPSEQMAKADVEALAGARKSIDLAAFVLTDRGVIGALGDAARRGVVVRVYIDRDESARASAKAVEDLKALATLKGVAIRTKAERSEAMHLKSYMVDRRLLRTGSANFSYSGERFQDNDVAMLESPALAAAFLRNFEAMWARPDNRDFPEIVK